jgi:hypothetical protein
MPAQLLGETAVDNVPWYVNLIVAWAPFMVLIWAALSVSRAIRAVGRTQDGRSLAQVMDDHARELRRANDLLHEARRQQ